MHESLQQAQRFGSSACGSSPGRREPQKLANSGPIDLVKEVSEPFGVFSDSDFIESGNYGADARKWTSSMNLTIAEEFQ